MEFDTLDQYRRAVDLARVRRGDVVYVSRALYASLPEADQSWLWRHSLEARVQLVTDLDVEPPILVRRGWAAEVVRGDGTPSPSPEEPAATPPRDRGPFYCDVDGAYATMLFDEIAAFERALGFGVLQAGDCVQFTPEELRALPMTTYWRLEREVQAAGACLCEGTPPSRIAVFRRRARQGEAFPRH